MINELINDIKTVLTEDLLTDYWKKIIRSKKCHYTTGHCYATSEALYHILGGKKNGYKPMYGKTKKGNSHWWIEDSKGNILDVTAEQFYYHNAKPPYHNGIGSGFLTKEPSKRAQKIINRLKKLNYKRGNKGLEIYK